MNEALNILTDRQRHVIVGIIGSTIVGLMSYGMLTLLNLLKKWVGRKLLVTILKAVDLNFNYFYQNQSHYRCSVFHNLLQFAQAKNLSVKTRGGEGREVPKMKVIKKLLIVVERATTINNHFHV